MREQWINTTLGKLCDAGKAFLQTGPFGSQLHACDYVEVNGVPVVPTSAIGRRKIDSHELPLVSEQKAAELRRHRLQPGDILFARRGVQATGLSALVKTQHENWICGTGAILLRFLSPDIDPEYFSFFLASSDIYEWIRAHAIGSTMPNLNESVLQNMPVVLPSLPEQRAIAHVLGTLENKIELNRRMNTTREAMARAIFQSWFVDFDPVHAKARGEQPSGMDAATAALFPDSFEESELGPIPRGWRVAPLDEIADYQNGLALQKFPPQGDRFLPVLKIRELRQGYVDNNSNLADPDISEDCIVYNGNVVFSWSGSLLVDIWCGGMVALNQHLFKVTSEHYPKWFYYLWTLYHLREFQHIAAGKATTMGHIKRHHLSDALTVVPTDEVLQRADQIIAPFLHTIINYRLESRTLAELRDTLLPLLISGQIRIAAGANR